VTLAELLAVAGLCLPASLRALEPLMAAVPLLAQRRGVSVDAVNGYDRYVDIEAKILFVGIGIRFIWIKRKVKR